MTSAMRLGRIVGVLLLVQLATGLIIPYVLLRPLQSGFLETAAPLSDLVRLSILMLFVGAGVTVAIAANLWPHVRERSTRLGLWLLVLAAINFTLQMLENTHWLSMLTVSHAFADAGAAERAVFQTSGIVMRAAWRWTHYSHILVVVGWLFLLHWLMFRCALVPRVLAAMGMVACLLQFIGITLPAFGGYAMPFPTLFGMPLGVASLMLSGWLMAKGFRAPIATSR